MANHTIYVSKAGLKVWDKAWHLAKKEGLTMSGLIQRELRLWVEAEEAKRRQAERVDTWLKTEGFVRETE